MQTLNTYLLLLYPDLKYVREIESKIKVPCVLALYAVYFCNEEGIAVYGLSSGLIFI